MNVRFTEESIEIYEGEKSLLYWIKDEWTIDPDVVFSIANAIKLAYTEPEKLKKLFK